MAYPYQIAKYDVTNTQWTEFLNAKDPTGANALGLYDNRMALSNAVGGIVFNAAAPLGSRYSVKPTFGQTPVVFVSFYSALRFANWLNNGQGSAADTESGSYTLLGGTPQPTNFLTITRSAGAGVVIPTEDEWYKAAYYKGGGINAGYWTYATQSNVKPLSAPPSPGAINSANYFSDAGTYAVTGSADFDVNQDYLTDVGAYGGSPSAYGTYDQNGDVYQWLENVDGSFALTRGGSWNDVSDSMQSAFYSAAFGGHGEGYVGFRVAALPEPGGVALLAGIVMMLGRRRR